MVEAAGDAADTCTTVYLLGHNRGWEEAASALTGRAVQLKAASAALLEAHAATWRDAFREGPLSPRPTTGGGGDEAAAGGEEGFWELVGVV